MTYAHDALRPAAASKPVAVTRLAGTVVAFPRWLRNFLRNRRAMRQLSEMSDWQLADIGLTRCDIGVAAFRSVPGAETRMLSDLAHERARVLSASRQIT